MSESLISAMNCQKESAQKTCSKLYRNLAVTGVAGIAFSALSALASFAADRAVLPLKSISLDSQKQLVIEFANHGGGFPTVPHVLDLPGPNHRIVVDLAGATIEKGSLVGCDELTTRLSKRLPAIRGVRYYNQTNTDQPTARIVVDLPEAIKAEPRVVKVDQSAITIDFGNEVKLDTKPAPPLSGSALPPSGATESTEVATAGLMAAEPSDESSVIATAFASAEAGSGVMPAVADATALAAVAPALANAPTAAVDSMAPTSSQFSESAQSPERATALIADASPVSQPAPDKNGGGWDWSTAPAAAAPAAAPRAIAQTGADSAAPAAQPASASDAAELRPAIGSSPSTAPSAISEPAADQPMSAVPLSSGNATPVGAEPSASSLKAAVKLYNSAVKNHLAGKLPDAINDYKGAIAANPQLAQAHSNLGLIYNQQHNYQPALVEFRKALAIDPKDAITYNGIGAALRAEKDLPGAIKNWQTAVSLDPHLATAHYNLGTAYEIQKDYDRALEAYKEAVKNDYRLGEAYYRMGMILERKHQLDDASTQFKEALKISTDSDYSEDARKRLDVLTKGQQTAAKK